MKDFRVTYKLRQDNVGAYIINRFMIPQKMTIQAENFQDAEHRFYASMSSYVYQIEDISEEGNFLITAFFCIIATVVIVSILSFFDFSFDANAFMESDTYKVLDIITSIASFFWP